MRVIPIREGDYCGGDVDVVVDSPSDDWGERDVIIRWKAWGGHGEVTIAVEADEARLLAAALLDAVTTEREDAPNGRMG